MVDLGCAWVNLDQVWLTRGLLQDEIKAEEPRHAQLCDYAVDCVRYSDVIIQQANHSRIARWTLGDNSFNFDMSDYFSFPTGYGAIRRCSGNIFLDSENRPHTA